MALIRKARLSDLNPIHALVNDFAKDGMMLPLAVGDLTDRLRDFLVAEEKGRIVGSVAVHVTWETLVELRSLAVARERQTQGLGKKLVDSALDEARALGATEIFTLTYIPEFFEKFGFRCIDRATLPHKIWQDCMKCPKFPDCGEVALTRKLE